MESKRTPRPPVVSVLVVIFLVQIATFVVQLWLQLAELGEARLETLGAVVTEASAYWDSWVDVVLFDALFLLTAASIFVVIGLARTRPWAWLWAMTIQGLRLLIGLIAYFRGDPYTLALLVPLIAVLLIDQVPVRRAFGQERGLSA
jgi:hypothetical protein